MKASYDPDHNVVLIPEGKIGPRKNQTGEFLAGRLNEIFMLIREGARFDISWKYSVLKEFEGTAENLAMDKVGKIQLIEDALDSHPDAILIGYDALKIYVEILQGTDSYRAAMPTGYPKNSAPVISIAYKTTPKTLSLFPGKAPAKMVQLIAWI